jgi:hypothetical protein
MQSIEHGDPVLASDHRLAAHTYTYRRAERSRFCQASYRPSERARRRCARPHPPHSPATVLHPSSRWGGIWKRCQMFTANCRASDVVGATAPGKLVANLIDSRRLTDFERGETGGARGWAVTCWLVAVRGQGKWRSRVCRRCVGELEIGRLAV